MRKPERISSFLYILSQIWNSNPQLRFGQLISLAFSLRSGNKYDGRLWHIEDDDFLERLVESMYIEVQTTKEDAQKHLVEKQNSIQSQIDNLEVFDGQDWRLS